jgi:hypothetical protein
MGAEIPSVKQRVKLLIGHLSHCGHLTGQYHQGYYLVYPNITPDKWAIMALPGLN